MKNRFVRIAGAWTCSACLWFFAMILAGQNPARPTATVEGVVTNTSSGFVSGARVTLTPQAGGGIVNADSDAEGKFQLSNLAPGRYAIAVTQSGFLRSQGSGPLNIALAADQQLKNLKLELTAAGVITGHVLDQDQHPVASATVVALKKRYDNSFEYLLPPRASRQWYPGAAGVGVPEGSEVQTGPDGEYRLYGLEPGEYYVGVWSKVDNGEHSVIPAQYYPGVIDPDLATTLSVGLGRDQFGMDIHLTYHPMYTVQFKAPSAACVYGNTRTFSLVRRTGSGLKIPVGLQSYSDKVPDSFLLMNADLTAKGLSVRPVIPDSAKPFKRVGDNTWISPPLYPGMYEILYTSCYVILEDAGADVGSLTVNIVDKDVDSMIMDIRDSVALRGRVIVASDLTDRINLKGLRVALMDVDDRTTALMPSKGVFNGTEPLMTLKEGAIDIPHLPMGRYAIGLLGGVSRLPADVYVASIRIGGRDVRETGFDLDGSVDSLEIRLEGNGGSIEGIVQNAKQEPVADAQVVLIPPPAQRNNITRFKTATPDQYGAFVMNGIAPGDYGLLAWESVEPGAYQNAEFLKTFEGRATKVHVERGTKNNERLTVIPSH